MDYATARELIEDGDGIMIRKKSGVLAALTRFFTGKPYTHSGIAVWQEGRLWMTELNSGHNHLVPLSQFASGDFDVYQCPVLDRAAVNEEVMEAMDQIVPYGVLSFIVIGLCEKLGLSTATYRGALQRVYVCSGYVVLVWNRCGWAFNNRLVSPGKLASQLVLKLEVRA